MTDHSNDAHPFRDCELCGSLSSQHPTRHISWHGNEACIDVEVAELVLACWQVGIDTDESCQDCNDDGQSVFLAFSDPIAYQRFGRLVMLGGPKNEMFTRMTGLVPSTDRWEWNCFPVDLSSDWDDPAAPVEPSFMASLVFPVADVKATTLRLLG